jgi:hypothetical protein
MTTCVYIVLADTRYTSVEEELHYESEIKGVFKTAEHAYKFAFEQNIHDMEMLVGRTRWQEEFHDNVQVKTNGNVNWKKEWERLQSIVDEETSRDDDIDYWIYYRVQKYNLLD